MWPASQILPIPCLNYNVPYTPSQVKMAEILGKGGRKQKRKRENCRMIDTYKRTRVDTYKECEKPMRENAFKEEIYHAALIRAQIRQCLVTQWDEIPYCLAISSALTVNRLYLS